MSFHCIAKVFFIVYSGVCTYLGIFRSIIVYIKLFFSAYNSSPIAGYYERHSL